MIEDGATIWARKTLESEIFFDKPDKWFKVWFYIVNKAYHQPHNRLMRGQCFLRYEWITTATKATQNQVKHCIEFLKARQMLATQKATRGMVITVVKYELYQNLDNYKSHTKRNSKGTQKPHRSHTEGKQKPHSYNKYVNNGNNVKNVNNGKTPPKGGLGVWFENLWEIYPKTVGKVKAWESYRKLNPSEALHSKILNAIREQSLSDQWKRENGRYIPKLVNWLDQEGWDDVLPRKETIKEMHKRLKEAGELEI